MAICEREAPPEEIRQYFVIKDGLLYWSDIPENKYKQFKRLPIGCKNNCIDTNYVRVRVLGRSYPLHRINYFLHTGEWPEIVDHIDRDKTNNHIDNLRAATSGENTTNQACVKYGISCHVSKRTGEKSYKASLELKKKHFYIGTYRDELTALYAAWRIRDLLYPGFAVVPAQIAELVQNLR